MAILTEELPNPATAQHAGSKRGILVTGSIRTGTTWVGKTLALSSQLNYVEEPFNPLNQDLFGTSFPVDFFYVHEGNQSRFKPVLDCALGFQFTPVDLFRRLWVTRNPRFFFANFKYFSKFNLNGLGQKRPLIKDPIALFSAEWLANAYNLAVLVMIRHPAAFYSSMKRVGWGFDFNWFADQPELIERYLSDYKDLIDYHVREGGSYIERATSGWLICYDVVRQYQQQHPEWLYYRHEDIAAQPEKYYKELFDLLGITWSPAIAQSVAELTAPTNITIPKEKEFTNIKRNSKAIVENWRIDLSDKEVNYIYNKVRGVSKHFYSDDEW